MAFVLNDRVLETSTTTGTAAFALLGAPTGYQNFSSGIGGSNTTYYAAFNTVANEWELGLGTLNAGATELTRTTIYSSSNSNNIVNFSAGTKNVFVTMPASRSVENDQPNIFTAANTFRAANAIRSEAADTQDAVVIAGRAGGTSSYDVTVTPTTLTADRILTLPDATTTVAGTDAAQALSNKTITYTAGTTTVAPIVLTSGTNLTSAAAGAVEYDGVRFYGTTDTVSGRGYIPSVQLFRLTANGAAIGPAIANYFGTNSAINLAGGGEYELEAYCYFTKTTAGTVTVTLTTSAAVVNLNGTVDYGAAAGGTATGAANRISLFASAATANAFGASASLTTAVNHAFVIRAILDANASNSDLRINFTSSAGTVTPLLNSYYKVTRLPAGNSGSFAA
jgi:hypothetical protein